MDNIICGDAHGWLKDGTFCEIMGGGMGCIDGKCICKEARGSDLTFMRQRDCTFPGVLMNVFHSLVIIACCFFLCYAFNHIKDSTGTARTMIKLSIAYGLSIILHTIEELAQKNILTSFGVFSINITFSIGFVLSYVGLYSIASPLYKIAELPDHRMRLSLKLLCSMFRCIQFSLVIAMIVAAGNQNDERNDLLWNYLIASFLLSAAIEVSIIYVGINFVATRMIAFVQNLIKLTPDDPNHGTTKLYVQKLKVFISRVHIIVPILILGWLYYPVSMYLIQYVPYSYVGYIVLFGSNPFTMFMFARYATRERLKDDKQDDPSQQQILSINNAFTGNQLLQRQLQMNGEQYLSTRAGPSQNNASETEYGSNDSSFM